MIKKWILILFNFSILVSGLACADSHVNRSGDVNPTGLGIINGAIPTASSCNYADDDAMEKLCEAWDKTNLQKGVNSLSQSRMITPPNYLRSGVRCVTAAVGAVRHLYDPVTKKCSVTKLKVVCAIPYGYVVDMTGVKCLYDPCHVLQSFKCYYQATPPLCSVIYNGKGAKLKSMTITYPGARPKAVITDATVTNFGSNVYGPTGPQNNICHSDSLNARLKEPDGSYSNYAGMQNCTWTYDPHFGTAAAGSLTVTCAMSSD